MISIEKRFIELRGNLYKPLLFFIPKSILTQEVLESFGKEIQEHLLDTLLLIKQDGALYKLNNQPVLYNMFQKKTTLDASVFKIFEIKDQLKSQQFEFFIQRYFTEVDAYLYISDWLYNNRALCKQAINNEIKEAFRSQQQDLKQHLEDLKQHCLTIEEPIKKERSEILDFIQNGIPELKAFLTDRKSNKNENQEQEIKAEGKEDIVQIKNGIKKTINKKKSNRITEKEAEDFLLETMFNIKVKKETENG